MPRTTTHTLNDSDEITETDDVAVEISDAHISPILRAAMAGEQVTFPIPEAEQGQHQEA